MFKMKKKYRSILIVVVIGFLLIHYWDRLIGLLGMGVQASIPLLVGGVMAYALNILMTFYEKYFPPKVGKLNLDKLRRPVCIVLSMISFVLIVIFICALIIPELTGCIKLLLKEIPEFWRQLQANWKNSPEILNYLNEVVQKIDVSPAKIEEMISKGASVLGAGFGGAMNTLIAVVSSMFSMLVTLLVAVVFAIYLLAGKEKLAQGGDRILRAYFSKWYDKIYYVLRVMHRNFRNFLVGQCVEAVILGGLCILGMLLLRLPYATMIGTLIGFTALIPVAGAYVGGAVGVFMILTVSPVQAIVFLVFLVVLQQIEGNLIYPKVVGSSLGLPGIWVLGAVTIGGGILGVFGMLLGVPLTATFYQLLHDNMQKKLGEDLAGQA